MIFNHIFLLRRGDDKVTTVNGNLIGSGDDLLIGYQNKITSMFDIVR